MVFTIVVRAVRVIFEILRLLQLLLVLLSFLCFTFLFFWVSQPWLPKNFSFKSQHDKLKPSNMFKFSRISTSMQFSVSEIVDNFHLYGKTRHCLLLNHSPRPTLPATSAKRWHRSILWDDMINGKIFKKLSQCERLDWIEDFEGLILLCWLTVLGFLSRFVFLDNFQLSWSFSYNYQHLATLSQEISNQSTVTHIAAATISLPLRKKRNFVLPIAFGRSQNAFHAVLQ